MAGQPDLAPPAAVDPRRYFSRIETALFSHSVRSHSWGPSRQGCVLRGGLLVLWSADTVQKGCREGWLVRGVAIPGPFVLRLQLFSAANMYFFCLTAFSASNTRFFHLMYFFRIVADFFHLKFFSRFQEMCLSFKI